MGQFINKGNEAFSRCRAGEYIDKSGLIEFFNSRLKTENNMVCVTRARRFGKTLAANMLYAYYDHSCDSHELFDDLEISGFPSYTTHRNKYPTLFLDLSDFIADKRTYGEDFTEGIRKEFVADLHCEYPEAGLSLDATLPDALSAIYRVTGKPFIFIIDEWDAPLREFQGSTKVEEDWIGFLRSIFKASKTKDAIAGVYITGILPIVRYNTQSALNNFEEFNLIAPKTIGKYLGFTEGEVKALCEKYNMDLTRMKSWYDGYQVGSIGHIFNPNSVMSAIRNREFLSYWTATGAGDELVPYLRHELGEDIQTLLEGGSIMVDTHSFDNRMDDINTRDKLFTALIHLGYLSYDGEEARIPNMELLLYFGQSVKDADLGGLTKVLGRSKEIIRCMQTGKADRVAELLGLCHDDICGAQEYNSEQGLYTTLRESLFFAHKDYIFHREYPSGKGFADLVLIPRPGICSPEMVIELKYDRDAESAITQIRKRNYPAKLSEYSGDIILAGINYDPRTKAHECIIETVSKHDHHSPDNQD